MRLFCSSCVCAVPTLLALLSGLSAAEPTASGPQAPRQWLVVGAFPNPELSAPTASGATRGGVDHDFLAPIGGETIAALTREAAAGLRVDGAPAQIFTVEARIGAQGEAVVELDRVMPDHFNRVAYAEGVITSEREQEVDFRFGIDDSAKVWVNGRLVHDRFHPGRAVTLGDEDFPVTLQPGANTVRIKIDNGGGGWGFALLPQTAAQKAAQRAQDLRRDQGWAMIEAADGRGLLRDDPALPALAWRFPAVAAEALGSAALDVAWYGPDLGPVTSAAVAGRYTALVTYRDREGRSARRAIPLIRTTGVRLDQGGWDWDVLDLPAPGGPWDAARWKADAGPAMRSIASDLLNTGLRQDPLLAVLQSDLVGAPSTGSEAGSGNAPLTRWVQQQTTLKRTLLGLGAGKRVGPTRLATPVGELRPGTPVEAGVRPEAVERIRAAAVAWASAEQRPFVVCLARHGTVFFHEAVGVDKEGKALPLDHGFYPASIGKTLNALVFAQFLDRGWLRPEQPVGEVLSGWPTTGPTTLTFRGALDHTSGLSGHSTYGGLNNPWLDEALALHVLPTIRPGTAMRYNGDGGNLAATAMELVDCRAFTVLQREALFQPLGITTVDQWDAGWAANGTVLDLAKAAQLMLQRGSYGSWRFFGEDTWTAMLPRHLSEVHPGLAEPNEKLDAWRGLGLQFMDQDWDQPVERRSVGHGSASSTVWRIDPARDLVMVVGRLDCPDWGRFQKADLAFLATVRRELDTPAP